MSAYFKIYNPQGYDPNYFYPLFHCNTYVPTFFDTKQRAEGILKTTYPDGILIECDWDRPKWYRDHTHKEERRFNGNNWIVSK